MEDSIMLVQLAPSGFEQKAPLVMIHDGGGTTVGYFYLESLDRPVFGIQNPKFYSGENWEGGLPEMGRVYAGLIRSVIPTGPIILGGWSLGGMLSLEVASVLARSSDIEVLGILMLDSVNPLKIPAQAQNVAPHQVQYGRYVKQETRELVSKCMEKAMKMATNWIPPVWKGCKDQTLITRRKGIEEQLSARLPAEHGDLCSTAELAVQWRDNYPAAPQAVLLRCNEYVPVVDTKNHNTVARVDLTRGMEKLGWEDYADDIVSTVLDIPGHHFNIFDENHLEDLTRRVKLGCRMIERVSV